MLKKIITVGILITFSMTASAGLINTTENSFIDENSSLEWMDFGVNNTDTYDFVSSQLGAGQAYEGWRLATIDEVYNMYSNTFLGLAADNVNFLDSVGRSTVIDGRNESVSVLDSIFEIMGYNTQRRQGTPFEIRYASGLFQGDEGLSLFKTHDVVGSFEKRFAGDQVSFYDHADFDYLSNNSNLEYSTMLVKNINSEATTSVPEPSTLAIFTLGIFGLASRKFTKKS